MPINVTALNAVPTICATCGSYFHRFLDHCPRCGWARASAYAAVIPDAPPQVDGPLPRTKAELTAWLIAHRVPRDVALQRIEEASSIGDQEPLAANVFAGMAINSIPGQDGHFNSGPYLAGAYRFGAHKTGRLQLGPYVRKLTYRYRGGVSDHPDPVDADLSYGDGLLLLRSSRGRDIAQIRPESVLFATSFVEQTGNRSWLGISFGNVVYFPDHSFTGGALQIMWAIGSGATQSLVVGNREGWTARKGEPGFYYGMVRLIGLWANMAACARLAEVGGPTYARELGFIATDP